MVISEVHVLVSRQVDVAMPTASHMVEVLMVVEVV